MDPISANINGVQSLVGSKLNKINSGVNNESEGVNGEFEDILTLKLDDAELLRLSRLWTNNYAGYEAKIKLRQQANETYYLGKQKEGSAMATTEGMPIAANLLFEAEETFLPAAFSKNPEPVVYSDNSAEGDALSNNVKTMLQYHAKVLCLRSKLQLMTRKWTIDFLGVLKHGWDDDIKEICVEVRNAKDFIFDPDGYVDVYGDFIGALGERIKVTASRLCELFPKHKAYITAVCDGKMGTDVVYTEWWNDDYTFVTFKNQVLDKSKNPYFNYKKESTVDELGNEIPAEDVVNHFFKAKKPYTLLSVFTLGEHPHDITGLIEQNIPNQRRISRRTEQIDFNLSRANNSTVFSANNFTEETAKQAATAIAKGHPVLVPAGKPINEAIHQLPGQGIEQSYFTELEISKNDLRSSFGTEGITAQPPARNELATGLILNENHDSSRIGGGIGDKIEQVASSCFNWFVQLYCVYYDVEHEAAIMGQMKAVEYVKLKASDLTRKLVVTVSPDSMKPKDEMSEMNQAMKLFEAGVLDPKTLLTKLNFPDPQNTAEQSVLWMLDKSAYMQMNFPELAQKMAQIQQEAMAGQNQMAQQQEAQQAQQKDAQVQQQMSQTEASHQQKLNHSEQIHQQKLEQSKQNEKTKEPINNK